MDIELCHDVLPVLEDGKLTAPNTFGDLAAGEPLNSDIIQDDELHTRELHFSLVSCVALKIIR